MKIKTQVKYCGFCFMTEDEVRRRNRMRGARMHCQERGTEQGYHAFGIKTQISFNNNHNGQWR